MTIIIVIYCHYRHRRVISKFVFALTTDDSMRRVHMSPATIYARRQTMPQQTITSPPSAFGSRLSLCFKCSKIASVASLVDSRARAAGGGVLGFVAIAATTPGSWSRARPDDARGWEVGVGRAGQGVHAVASALAECGSRKGPALKTVSIAAGDLYLNCGILRALTPGHITPLRAHTPSRQHSERERERARELFVAPKEGVGGGEEGAVCRPQWP